MRNNTNNILENSDSWHLDSPYENALTNNDHSRVGFDRNQEKPILNQSVNIINPQQSFDTLLDNSTTLGNLNDDGAGKKEPLNELNINFLELNQGITSDIRKKYFPEHCNQDVYKTPGSSTQSLNDDDYDDDYDSQKSHHKNDLSQLHRAGSHFPMLYPYASEKSATAQTGGIQYIPPQLKQTTYSDSDNDILLDIPVVSGRFYNTDNNNAILAISPNNDHSSDNIQNRPDQNTLRNQETREDIGDILWDSNRRIIFNNPGMGDSIIADVNNESYNPEQDQKKKLKRRLHIDLNNNPSQKPSAAARASSDDETENANGRRTTSLQTNTGTSSNKGFTLFNSFNPRKTLHASKEVCDDTNPNLNKNEP